MSLVIIINWLLFALLHLHFQQEFLYWHYIWLDLVMHFWGGGLVIATWYVLKEFTILSGLFSRLNLHPLFLLVIVMITWEIFKYLIGSIVADNYALDTVLDLLFGFSGGLVAFYLFRSRTIEK